MDERIKSLESAINHYMELFTNEYSEKMSDFDYNYIRGLKDALEIITQSHYGIKNYKLIKKEINL